MTIILLEVFEIPSDKETSFCKDACSKSLIYLHSLLKSKSASSRLVLCILKEMVYFVNAATECVWLYCTTPAMPCHGQCYLTGNVLRAIVSLACAVIPETSIDKAA